jgi:hypothetical protein
MIYFKILSVSRLCSVYLWDNLKRNRHGLIEVLNRHFIGGTEKYHDIIYLGQRVPRPRFEPRTRQIEVLCVIVRIIIIIIIICGVGLSP